MTGQLWQTEEPSLVRRQQYCGNWAEMGGGKSLTSERGRKKKSKYSKQNLSLSPSVLWLEVAGSGWPPDFSDLFIAIYLTLLFDLKPEGTLRLNINIPPALCSLLQRL